MKNTSLLFGVFALLTFNTKSQTVTDSDGNVYNTITIGTQIWMKENLKTTSYNDGTSIPNISNATAWSTLLTDAYCDYNNTPNNSITYGKLYNWYAATNVHKICPTDWHVPSDAEWNIMEKYLDSTVDTTITGYVGTDIGNKLKESGTTHWASGNAGINSSNFTAIPGGLRLDVGSFLNINNFGEWWTSSSSSSAAAWRRYLGYNNAAVQRSYVYKTHGFSIRCICDSLVTKITDNSIDKRIQIYPNPTIDMVYITNVDRKGFEMKIYNTIGDCVFQSDVNSGTNSMDISFLASGIYIIRLKGADGTFERKLIKN